MVARHREQGRGNRPLRAKFQFCKTRVLVTGHTNIWMYRRQWHPTPVLLPGKSHGCRSLVGCSPWGHWELDTTQWLHFHFSLSCIGEGNGSPLQCSCLENPRDGGAWWAAVHGVTQSRTRLKRLSSSSSQCLWYKWQTIFSVCHFFFFTYSHFWHRFFYAIKNWNY